METIARDKMTENQKIVEAALNALGYETMWAYRKGNGFWVRGLGYKSVRECAKLAGVSLKRNSKKYGI